MKNLLPALLFIVLLGSCCAQKDSCGTPNTIGLKFSGFTTTELDTIYITGYDLKTGEMSVPEELVSVDTTTVEDYLRLSATHKWKVYLPAVNRELIVAGYTYKKMECKSCGRKTHVDALTSCKVNDIAYTRTDRITIQK